MKKTSQQTAAAEGNLSEENTAGEIAEEQTAPQNNSDAAISEEISEAEGEAAV